MSGNPTLDADGVVCDCGQWSQCCGCGLHSLQANTKTQHGWLIHWRRGHWASDCALRVLAQERKEAVSIPQSGPPTPQTEEVDYAWGEYGDEWMEASIFALLDQYGGFEMDWEMAKREALPENPHDAVTNVRNLAAAIRERIARDNSAKDAIVDAAVEMFRAWEKWDWYSDPPARIEYWANRDYLEKLVMRYRERCGEPVSDFPVRDVQGASSLFPARPTGITRPPPWRDVDHAQEIEDFLRGKPRGARGVPVEDVGV